jgi:two-component system sensor histidine kinase CpxA
MLQSLVDDAQVEGKPANKQVRCEASCAAPFVGNEANIASAVENVLRNALRFTPSGGIVVARLREAPECYEISVCDQGPGVPEEDLARIFEPFYRAGHGSPECAEGSGVGLAITANAQRQHGGTVRARNLPEGGLEVLLIFPKPKTLSQKDIPVRHADVPRGAR